MATKTFGVNDALSNKLWSAKFAKEVEKKTYFGRFMGESEDNIIQVKTETSKAAGDKITCGLVMSLTGDGVTEGQALEGNEEDLTTYDDSILINELRHAVRVKNKRSIDAQRVPENLRSIARNRLSQWFATRMDTAMFLHLCGYTGAAFSRDNQTVDPTLAVYNGNNTVVAPSSSRIVRANDEANDQAINSASTHRFILEMIDEAVWKAKTATPYISPINIGGEDKYVMFLHPSQVRDLRTDASTSRITWYDTQKALLQGGEGRSRNPIFSGALGEYNGVILHEAYRIPNGVNSSSGAQVANTKRAVMCGKQAGMIATGREHTNATKYKWTEELFDYQNQLGVGIDTVFGIKKSVFNSVDYATIVVSSYGEDPS
ncbi:N4-gp56 family major capsid protein [Pseudohoeflea coraliihabitans]|uniref:N4-gp56 family major capsid protein n=1 Tax=Pseudohoeflea coraliihabitans TaxID=2860393 RepID=A0ABS6WTE1_9HYPH|nr:N4-gp56 family major capsid protein [Pseudohoeflea sp. DP4N28-3]MBW3099227.1 N4-gp56 family major capsid protein [Pseudohoeflea sp. DP4N28-3]